MLVFVDNELGEQGGLDFGHALKRHPEADGAKLVLISVTGEGVEPSTLNRAGFTFQIEKPLKHGEVLRCVRMLTGEAATDKVPTPPPKQSLVLRTSQGRSPRVLVVEDNPINQMVAQSLLERHGCQVALAGNGKEALHCLENTEYDLVLMDCEMPEMDGFEATSRIRESENGTWRLPIVAMTARAMHDDKDRCMTVGMDGYISKPIRVEQMLSEISRLI